MLRNNGNYQNTTLFTEEGSRLSETSVHTEFHLTRHSPSSEVLARLSTWDTTKNESVWVLATSERSITVG